MPGKHLAIWTHGPAFLFSFLLFLLYLAGSLETWWFFNQRMMIMISWILLVLSVRCVTGLILWVLFNVAHSPLRIFPKDYHWCFFLPPFGHGYPETPLHQAWCRWLDCRQKLWFPMKYYWTFPFGLTWPDLALIWYDFPGLWNDAFWLTVGLHARTVDDMLLLVLLCIPCSGNYGLLSPPWPWYLSDLDLGYLPSYLTWIPKPPNDCYVVLRAMDNLGLFSLRVRRTCRVCAGS